MHFSAASLPIHRMRLVHFSIYYRHKIVSVSLCGWSKLVDVYCNSSYHVRNIKTANFCCVPIATNNAVELKGIYDEMIGRRLKSQDLHIITEEISNLLSQRTLDTDSINSIAQIIRLIGKKCYYNQQFFDTISEVFQKAINEDLLLSILPCFLWTSSRARYYSPSLLNSVGPYILDNLKQYSIQDIDMIVNAYARLNHPFPELIQKMEKFLLSKNELQYERHLAWSVAWAGMVLKEYPKDLLSVILRDDYVKGM